MAISFQTSGRVTKLNGFVRILFFSVVGILSRFLISYIRWRPLNFRILINCSSAGNSERSRICGVLISDDPFPFGDVKENLEQLIIGWDEFFGRTGAFVDLSTIRLFVRRSYLRQLIF